MDKNLEKLNRILDVIDGDNVSYDELEKIIEILTLAIASLKEELNSKIESQLVANDEELISLSDKIGQLEQSFTSKINELKDNLKSNYKTIKDIVDTTVKDIKDSIPKPVNLALFNDRVASLEKYVLEKKNEKDIEDVKNELDALKKEVKTSARGIIIGGSRPIKVLQNGTEVSGSMTELNFVNATIDTVGVSRRRVNITTTGGLSKLEATGTVDGANTSFTFTSAPSIIVVDGVPLQKTQSDGTANWTGTTSVILLKAPVFDIFGL